ncbi:MAG: hypothetical protein WD025_00885 [Bacteriovoracaceae bacterium]
MARKYSYKHLGNLWKDNGSQLKLAQGKRQAFIKKAIDDVCLKADLSETTWDYSYHLCFGMIRLLRMGLSQSEMCYHPVLVQKLLRLGRDVMEYAQSDTDFFYLGAFIDLKISSKWRNIQFYRFIVDALLGIKKYLAFFSKTLKTKIQKEYKKLYPRDFDLYFSPKPLLTG